MKRSIHQERIHWNKSIQFTVIIIDVLQMVKRKRTRNWKDSNICISQKAKTILMAITIKAMLINLLFVTKQQWCDVISKLLSFKKTTALSCEMIKQKRQKLFPTLRWPFDMAMLDLSILVSHRIQWNCITLLNVFYFSLEQTGNIV